MVFIRNKYFFAFAVLLMVLAISNVSAVDIGLPTPPYTESQYSTSTILTFKWEKGSVSEGVTGFWLQVGTTPGGNDIFDKNVGLVYEYPVNCPEGVPVYVRVRAFAGWDFGEWVESESYSIAKGFYISSSLGGSINLPGGNSLDIPPLAISSNSYVQLYTHFFAPVCVSDGLITPTDIVRKIVFLSTECVCLSDMTLTIVYNDSEIGALNEENLRIFRYNEDSQYWESIASQCFPEENKIISSVSTGTFRVVESTGTEMEEIILYFSNYPNPFWATKENTNIYYNLSEDCDVDLWIYDLLRNCVFEKHIKAGEYGGKSGPNQIQWDGKNKLGFYVTQGAYILELEVFSIYSGKESMKRRKIAVLR